MPITALTATYGALDLSGRVLAIMTIVTVSLMGLSTLMYMMQSWYGILAHFISFVITVTLLVSWLTSLSQAGWNEGGPFPIVGALIVLGVNVLAPPMIAEWLEN